MRHLVCLHYMQHSGCIRNICQGVIATQINDGNVGRCDFAEGIADHDDRFRAGLFVIYAHDTGWKAC